MYTREFVQVKGYKVTKTKNQAVILSRQDFFWTSPQLVAVCGPNGSGKSTLLKIICGLESAGGNIRINNREPGDKPIRSQIAYCPSNPVLFSDLTILAQCEFIATLYACDGLDDGWWQLSELLGFSNDLLHRRPYHFSSGEKQKASILVSFARPYSIAVLDEPLRSLDKDSACHLVDWIRNQGLKYNVLTIIATHDDQILDCADVIHRLQKAETPYPTSGS